LASKKQTKNIDHKFHVKNGHLRKGKIDLEWIAGKDQLVDGFTKALGKILIERFNQFMFG
jgi:hypothetical protein